MIRRSTEGLAQLQLRLFSGALAMLRRTPVFRVIARQPLVLRIAAGFLVRPWLTDIGCGVVAIWWGIWVGLHHEEIGTVQTFARFAHILPGLVSVIVIMGAMQVGVAVFKNVTGRQLVSLTFITLWSGIAGGVESASGQAAYVGYAILNAFILFRAF